MVRPINAIYGVVATANNPLAQPVNLSLSATSAVAAVLAGLAGFSVYRKRRV